MARRVLPTPAGPTSVTRRWSRVSSASGGEVGGTSHERRGEGRQVVGRARKVRHCRAAGLGTRAARGSAAGSGSRAPARVGPGSTPSSSTSSRSHPRVGGQRVGLPARPVESGDEGGPQALPERIPLESALPARRPPRRRAPRSTRAAKGPRAGPAGPPPDVRRWACSHSPSPASTRTSPRNSASPSAANATAVVASPVRRAVAADAARPTTSQRVDAGRVDVQGVTAPPAPEQLRVLPAPVAAGRPSTAACFGPCSRRRPTRPRSTGRR